MPDDTSHELTLYVQSKKVIANFYRPPPGGLPAEERKFGGTGSVPAGARDVDASVGGEAFFLSDDQARCAALAEEIAARRGYKVTLVDVAKVGRLERLVAERLHGVSTFPVLVGPTGQRLEGCPEFTEDKLSEFMPTVMKNIRAFTYVKVRGGDLDQIRHAVLNFPEVREVHLLTGDWDAFIILEFSGVATNKRQVLDFVTDRIRTIPDVLDTSTLVPEYSVTKFTV